MSTQTAPSVRSAQIPKATPAYNPANINWMVNVLDQRLRSLEQPANSTGYTTPNSTLNHTLDASTVTLAIVTNVLQTLIQELQAKGILA